ncbi:DUF771 domain-containing protein [Loigolactobacillus coryniformis]|uniref:Uncharacterized protein n=1 Tax=Loigolactobacillus coryniformis subsp. torquens DSM 20004 = KCTC 3535 TaxID=1423822 RepID=A0A2D1KME3_9LACO|nr:DUF771 domain-containing protein [Loigolactobacillus coryniformis]ATO43299.1 hypothetical protein LC20004_05000 [Loigolactobacillus coryniformis subsp. torquens DSM 20004 = KCTC 3535]KRK85616.1 hypothetical protein FC16_GL000005 [Loigolactobacillus coryniformis subsp. torquens DSM 20004 = KCTC 3535]
MAETIEQMTERVVREEVRRKLDEQDFGLAGRMWNINDLRQWLGGKDKAWVKDNTVFNPRFSREIQAMIDDKTIIEGRRGKSWLFKADRFAAWLDKHWQDFNW